MFKWDGSEVSEYISGENIEIHEGKEGNHSQRYWRIEDRALNRVEEVLVKSSKSMLACVIDELKPVFKLEKIGTHWMRFRGVFYIISRVERDSRGNLLREISLKETEFEAANILPNITEEIRKIFLFRDFLATTVNFEKNIILRKKNFSVKPVSINETDIKATKDEKELKPLPDSIVQKWFENTDLNIEAAKFLNVDKLQDITNKTLQLRIDMEKVFSRLKVEGYVDSIIDRITKRLQWLPD